MKFKEYLEMINSQDLPFINDIKKAGGEIYSVGGKVRDEFLGKESKDLDLLIRGIPLKELENILKKYGTVNSVGQKFAVIKWKAFGDTEEIDIAVPRTEKKVGSKRTDFEVTSDPMLPIEDDLKRRDFTMNAIAKNLEGNIIDPHKGVLDIKNKIIRMISSDSFDPDTGDELRMLRSINFVSRFGFDIEKDTLEAVKRNAFNIKKTSIERITEEFLKINKGIYKAKAVKYLIETGLFKEIFNRTQCFTDLKELNNVKKLSELLYLICIDNRLESKELKKYISLENSVIDEYDSFYKWHDKYSFLNEKADKRKLLSECIKRTDILLNTDLNLEGIQYIKEFKENKYPKGISELKINGNDLIEKGFKNKEIGLKLNELLYLIYNDKIKNTYTELIKEIK